MAFVVDLKPVVKHIVDGNLAENLCRVCLMPLGNIFENVFTQFCTADVEFCIADVLEEICNIKIHPSEEYNVCSNCFVAASSAYKFYLLSHQSNNIINFYFEELEKHVDQLELQEDENISLCITLPSLEVNLPMLNFNVEDCLYNYQIRLVAADESRETLNAKMKNLDDEKLVLIVNEEDGKPAYYRIKPDGTLKQISQKLPLPLPTVHKCDKKISRKRDPMVSLQCSKCPVKYRFMSKFREHMKLEHNIDLHICKICKATFEHEHEYAQHQKTHTNTHYCDYCNAVFKKRETLITHIKAHEDLKNLSKMEGAPICELCGVILPNEEELKVHHDKKHNKQYTCYYCGRMYRGEISFEMHVKKHEQVMKVKDRTQIENKDFPRRSAKKKRLICATCGKDFGDERALKWHSMLHTNERPYTCDVCGRGFISVNRRNQHAVCAHTAPARRCPLCPALFHLRSMVNTHVKKVHLRAHKRRSRASKHQSAVWRTEAVPIQDLSVSIQSAILDLKSKQEEKVDNYPEMKKW